MTSLTIGTRANVYLSLNTNKTKEMIVELRMKLGPELTLICINGDCVQQV